MAQRFYCAMGRRSHTVWLGLGAVAAGSCAGWRAVSGRHSVCRRVGVCRRGLDMEGGYTQGSVRTACEYHGRAPGRHPCADGGPCGRQWCRRPAHACQRRVVVPQRREVGGGCQAGAMGRARGPRSCRGRAGDHSVWGSGRIVDVVCGLLGVTWWGVMASAHPCCRLEPAAG